MVHRQEHIIISLNCFEFWYTMSTNILSIALFFFMVYTMVHDEIWHIYLDTFAISERIKLLQIWYLISGMVTQ